MACCASSTTRLAPYGDSHVAPGLGGRAVAWTGKAYVVRRPAVSLSLHGCTGSSRTGGRRAEDQPRVLRSSCFQAVTGVCGCD
jgi:hypothetical protein